MLESNVNAQTLEPLIQENDIVFVDFWAKWCAPCLKFGKIYEQIASKYPSIVFAKINVEEESDLVEIFQIRSIPHLIVFKQGIAIFSEPGSMPESALTDLVNQAQAVEVDKGKA
jgi:thioredoxin 1